MIHIKIIFLFLIAWLGIPITMRFFRKQAVPYYEFILLAIGITGFIWSMGWLN